MYGFRPPPLWKQTWVVRVGAAALIAFLVQMGPLPAAADAQEAGDYFQQNCTMCHTVGGGRLIGPDLGGVTKRKDRAWLVKFLQDPKAMIDSGDPYASRLAAEAGGVVMPTPTGMTPSLADALLNYLEAGPGVAQAQTAESASSEQPFTPADAAAGRRIFLGRQRLAKGGPACISCHTLKTLGGLGGGHLGPDLTNAIDRLGGRRGSTAWLSSPPTTTMKAVFNNHPLEPGEVVSLLAAIDEASHSGRPESNASTLMFSGFGLGGMLIGLVLLQVAWRARIRSVRRSLVRPEVRGER